MPIIKSTHPFFLLFPDGTRIPISSGYQTVDAVIAAHPYIIATCEFIADAAAAPAAETPEVPLPAADIVQP